MSKTSNFLLTVHLRYNIKKNFNHISFKNIIMIIVFKNITEKGQTLIILYFLFLCKYYVFTQAYMTVSMIQTDHWLSDRVYPSKTKQ